jgi:hypothetical protein
VDGTTCSARHPRWGWWCSGLTTSSLVLLRASRGWRWPARSRSLEPAAAALAAAVLLSELLSPLQLPAIACVTAASVGAARTESVPEALTPTDVHRPGDQRQPAASTVFVITQWFLPFARS